MTGLIKRVKNGIWRRIDPSDKARIKRLMKKPPKIDPHSIVFNSSDDYTGNPKALFLYMIEHGYNKRYHITWLFEKEENYFKFKIPNVDSAIIYDKDRKVRAGAQKAIMSARYIFYSHNVNWCKSFREGQTFIDLWHGCGYKDDMRSVKRVIYYDHLMVTGSKYIDIFKRVLKKPDGDILDLGYPRNEMLFSSRSKAVELLAGIKKEAGADKAIIWMPTFRKSTIARLETDTGLGETGLPILCESSDIAEFDRWCRELGVLIVIKQHMFQRDYVRPDGLTNILFIDEDYLRDNDADLYEFMGRTDALITDYSSVAIDYLLVNKPLGYTLDDYDRYEEGRGFSFENVKEYMPGHHIYDIEGLKQFAQDIAEGKDPHAEWRARVRPEMQTYTDGFSKRILEYFNIK
ncbi:MAG: CDP-glycerol glycerophosphotransferase family protein [Mogibacterium sp.]|nr:CDP-glycerol glycerophosphotransferase family protein [Mogibacterium sp.]MBQ6501019.1 CDP-glycerol glycerophosphotransferase family protein [Mogibacterium sp.]